MIADCFNTILLCSPCTQTRRLADLAEQERRARRSAENAAGLGVESLSLEEDLAAQALAFHEDEEEAGTGR